MRSANDRPRFVLFAFQNDALGNVTAGDAARMGNCSLYWAMEESALIFDTHVDIRELVEAGMPEPQAETVVRQRVRLLERNLATKADIAKTNARIETLRQETKADIAATNASIGTLRQETKAVIETLRQETRANIETLRQETEKLIALGKNDIVKWVVGANLGVAAMIVAAIKLL